MTDLVELQKAVVHVLVRLGFVLPTRLFVEEACRQVVEKNREVFDRLAKT